MNVLKIRVYHQSNAVLLSVSFPGSGSDADRLKIG